jgi:hypothetical protein
MKRGKEWVLYRFREIVCKEVGLYRIVNRDVVQYRTSSKCNTASAKLTALKEILLSTIVNASNSSSLKLILLYLHSIQELGSTPSVSC